MRLGIVSGSHLEFQKLSSCSTSIAMMVPMSKPQSSLCVYSERAKMVVAVTWTLCQAKVNKGQKHCDEVVLHLGVLCINAVQYLGEGVAHL